MHAQEWLPAEGTTDARQPRPRPDLQELGRRVALEFDHQSVLLDDPADHA